MFLPVDFCFKTTMLLTNIAMYVYYSHQAWQPSQLEMVHHVSSEKDHDRFCWRKYWRRSRRAKSALHQAAVCSFLSVVRSLTGHHELRPRHLRKSPAPPAVRCERHRRCATTATTATVPQLSVGILHCFGTFSKLM